MKRILTLVILSIGLISCANLENKKSFKLIEAAKKGNNIKIEELIKKGYDVNERDELGKTALEYYIEYYKDEYLFSPEIDMIKKFIDAGAKPVERQLPNLVENFDEKFLLNILTKFPNMDLNVKDEKGNTTLLAVVKMHFSLQTIQLLVEKGANPLVKNNGEENAIHKYMERNCLYDTKENRDTLNYLISLGIPINDVNIDGETPLTLAAKYKNFNTISTLIENGANPNLGEIEGLSILDYLIKNGEGQFFSDFYDKGAKLTENTPFLALESTSSDCFKELIDLNIDINHRNVDGRSLLMESISYYKNDRTKLLLEKEADINIIDNNGDTALILATKEHDSEKVEMLLKFGADTNIKNNKGDTALVLATENGDSKIVEMLLNFKADANIKNNSGNNSLIVAKYKEQDKLLKTFEQYNFRITETDEETAIKILENNKKDNLNAKEQKKDDDRFIDHLCPNILFCKNKDNSTILDIGAIIISDYLKDTDGLGFGLILSKDDIVPYMQLSVCSGLLYFIDFSTTGRIGYSKNGNEYIGINFGFTIFGIKAVMGVDSVKKDDSDEKIAYLGFGFGY